MYQNQQDQPIPPLQPNGVSFVSSFFDGSSELPKVEKNSCDIACLTLHLGILRAFVRLVHCFRLNGVTANAFTIVNDTYSTKSEIDIFRPAIIMLRYDVLTAKSGSE
jgi:hypothetical protein